MPIPSANIKLDVSVTKTKLDGFGSAGVTGTNPLAIAISQALDDGAGANAIEDMWHDRRTLATGAADNLDFNALTDQIFEDASNFNGLKLLFIRNNSTTDTLQVGGNANALGLFAAANDKLVLQPGQWFCTAILSAGGIAITNGASDVLDVTHGGDTSASLTYDIAVLGIVA